MIFFPRRHSTTVFVNRFRAGLYVHVLPCVGTIDVRAGLYSSGEHTGSWVFVWLLPWAARIVYSHRFAPLKTRIGMIITSSVGISNVENRQHPRVLHAH